MPDTAARSEMSSLARYGISDPAEERALRARLRAFYERTLEAGQGAYFHLRDGRLVPTPMGRYWLAEHLRHFTRLLALTPNDRLLDIGCGEGYYTIPLARQAGLAVGVDLSGSVLRVLKGLDAYDPARLKLVHGDVERLPFADESFDKILCSHVLEHVLDDHAVLAETRRLLRPDGRAVLAIPLKYTPQYRAVYAAIGVARAVLKPGKQATPTPPPGALNHALIGRQAHIRHHSLASFSDLVRSEGLAVERVTGVWLHDPRNWAVRWTQRRRATYLLGTLVSKIWPGAGAGLVMAVRRA